MTKKTYATSDRTRRKLFAVAMDLFAKQGYAQTTTRQIAAEAEVSTATLFRYFPKKSDFLGEIGMESATRLEDFLDAIPQDLPLMERIMMFMSEDLAGHVGQLYERIERDGVVLYRAGNLRLAYMSLYAEDRAHLERELQARRMLATHYNRLLSESKAKGELVCEDTESVAEAIAYMFFLGNDEATLSGEFMPLEDMFRRRVSAILEGKLA